MVNFWLTNVSKWYFRPGGIRSKHAWNVDLQGKMGKIDFSQNFHWAILIIDHKCSFYNNKPSFRWSPAPAHTSPNKIPIRILWGSGPNEKKHSQNGKFLAKKCVKMIFFKNCPKCQFLGQIGHFLLKNGS